MSRQDVMNEYGMPITWAEGTGPTTEQLVEWFMSLTSTDKVKWMGRTQDCMEVSTMCIGMDHQGRVEMLEQALVKATSVINDLSEDVSG